MSSAAVMIDTLRVNVWVFDYFSGEIKTENLTEEEWRILTPFIAAMLRLGDRDEKADQAPTEDYLSYDGPKDGLANGKLWSDPWLTLYSIIMSL